MLFRKLLHPNTSGIFTVLKYGFPNHNKTGISKAASQTTKPMCHYMHWVSRLWTPYCSLFKEMFKIMSLSVVNLTFRFWSLLLWWQFLLHSLKLCLYPKGFGITQATFVYKTLNPCPRPFAPSMPKLAPLANDHPIHLEAPVPEPSWKKQTSVGYHWKNWQ